MIHSNYGIQRTQGFTRKKRSRYLFLIWILLCAVAIIWFLWEYQKRDVAIINLDLPNNNTSQTANGTQGTTVVQMTPQTSPVAPSEPETA